ncbi:alpha/beta fold hydrolase [Allokutzneria sp. A3M-2-11 16]|uniref:alpha/beta fold hydrolase n=1 Tax=Allokutzneria sp. A3M-2-11 16 TaxID=2962043 RepID=UPI0027E26079|nr:alpha/beta hydrolase [Allokutzneria sp. A3M-2-11 16]
MTVPFPSPLTPHRGTRVELPSRYGPIAALRAMPDPSADLGAVALLVPGYPGSKEDFAPLLDPISDAGFDVVAIDLPGLNESGGPEEEAAYRPGALGEVVAELITDLGDGGTRPVLLLGHSFGGLVTRAAVLVGARIAGLTLLCSGPSELPDGDRRQAIIEGEPILRTKGMAAAQELREARDARRPGWAHVPQRLKEFYRRRFLASKPAGLLGMADGLRYEPDLVPKLGVVLQSSGTPSLVVCGEGDDVWPVSAQRDMAERLDADFAVLAGAGHSPNVENPEALLATLLPTWRAWLTEKTP